MWITEQLRVRVSAENRFGRSEPLECGTSITLRRPLPATPSGPLEFGEVAADHVLLRWTNDYTPEELRTTGLQQLKLMRRRRGEHQWEQVCLVPATAREWRVDVDDAGLDAGTSLQFALVAVGAHGESGALESAAVTLPPSEERTPPAHVPNAPALKIVAQGMRYVVLEWTVPPCCSAFRRSEYQPAGSGQARRMSRAGGSEHQVDGFVLLKRTRGGASAKDRDRDRSWELVYELPHFISRVTVANLETGGEFEFGIQAFNHMGSSAMSTAGPVLVGETRFAPPAPTGPLTASHSASVEGDADADVVTVRWTRPAAERNSSPTQYLVEARAAFATLWQHIGAVAAASNELKVAASRFVPGVAYELRCIASNAAGASEPLLSEKLQLLVPLLDVPDVPVGPLRAQVSEAGDRSVRLEWNAPQDDGHSAILGYVLEMKDAEMWRSAWQPLKRLDASSTAADVGELPAGRELLFRVGAINKKGVGPYLTLKQPISFIAPPGMCSAVALRVAL